MNDQNGPEPQSLGDLLAPIQARYEQIELEVKRRKTYLQQAKDEATTLRNILKSAGLLEKQQRGGGKRRQAGDPPRGPSVSQERFQDYTVQLREYASSREPTIADVPGSWTIPEVEKDIGLHHGALQVVVRMLREEGVLRLAGKHKINKGGQAANVYVFDE